jgi:hypothetical protein
MDAARCQLGTISIYLSVPSAVVMSSAAVGTEFVTSKSRGGQRRLLINITFATV